MIRAVAHRLVDPLITYRRHFIWEASLDRQRSPAAWADGERLQVIGPDAIDSALTPRLLEFLGGGSAADDLRGVREGDRLLVVTRGDEYAFVGYIYFDTTAATRRQKRIFGELPGTPVIGTCFTAPAARGKGIYKRVLNDAFRYLQRSGCTRVTADVNTHNDASNRASAGAGMRVCRELQDWTLFRHVVIQKITEAGRTRWRLFVI